MAKLIWSDKVVAALEDIYDYIAADSPFYARYQVEKITNSIERLQAFPESGRHLPEFPQLPYREIIVNAYRVIYRYDSGNKQIFLLNVVHGKRLLTKSSIATEDSNDPKSGT